MDGYELDESPFYFKQGTLVSLYKGCVRGTELHVVVKCHDFLFLQQKETQTRMVQTINAALAQAKVQHPNACGILEVQMEIESTNCRIFHVLEALETDLEQDIEERQRTNTPYVEEELREMLQQTASVLAYAHNKKIAHRDVKPSNTFRTAHTYKLGDFGCFFIKQDTSMTKSEAGDARYMSPQLRKACLHKTSYNAFKTDVFALGASLLHMATLTSPFDLVTAELMQEAVDRVVETLSCSKLLKDLIRGMLACEEELRPTMQQVCEALAQPLILPKGISSPTTVAGVFEKKVFLYEIQSQQLFTHTLSADFGIGGSYVEADRNTLLCVGANPPSSAVHSLDLSSFQLSPLLSLSTPRAGTGLAKVKTHFYAFGGEGKETLSSCEKLQVSDQCWTQISNMHHPRAYFTPCSQGSLLYLASADGHKTVETFNAETETFAVLSVSLPPELHYAWSVAFFAGEELCLLTNAKQMVRWKIASEFSLSASNNYSWSTQQPLLVNSLVLIVCLGGVQRFSLETYSFLD